MNVGCKIHSSRQCNQYLLIQIPFDEHAKLSTASNRPIGVFYSFRFGHTHTHQYTPFEPHFFSFLSITALHGCFRVHFASNIINSISSRVGFSVYTFCCCNYARVHGYMNIARMMLVMPHWKHSDGGNRENNQSNIRHTPTPLFLSIHLLQCLNLWSGVWRAGWMSIDSRSQCGAWM